jgi:hypothetical protein
MQARAALLLALLAALLAALPALPAGMGLDAQVSPPNVRVTTAQGPANEVHVAVNPLDPDNLVAAAKDYTIGTAAPCGEPGARGTYNVWAGYYWSTDGGHTWGNGLMPGYPGGLPGSVSLLTGYQCSSDPVVAFDGLGHAHYLGLAYQGFTPAGTLVSTNMLWLATSLDGGATWPVILKVAELPYPAFFNDKEWFAIDPVTNIATVTWTEFLPVATNIMVARCVLGEACSPPLAITLPFVESVQGSAPAVGPDGTVHVVWNDYRSRCIRYTSAPLGSAFLVPDRCIAPNVQFVGGQPNSGYRTPSMPAVAVDRSGGPHDNHVYVAWTDGRSDASDIYAVRSPDGGATWTAAFRVNGDPLGRSNFFPAVGVAPSGRADIAFYDRRDDPANRFNLLYLASSTDGGLTWPNTRVGEVPFDGTGCYHQQGFSFIGDYIGVASTDANAFPVWADSRNGRCDVYTAIVPR